MLLWFRGCYRGECFRWSAGNTLSGWPRWDLVNPTGAFCFFHSAIADSHSNVCRPTLQICHTFWLVLKMSLSQQVSIGNYLGYNLCLNRYGQSIDRRHIRWNMTNLQNLENSFPIICTF